MNKESPRSQALHFLNGKILEARNGSPRLPNLDELARQAAVSRVTMHKAVREFVAKGILKCAPRIGIRLSSAVASTDLSKPLAGKSRTIRQTIEHDIIEGAFQDNILPSLKELCARYGATYQTMKKVTDDLERCQIVKRSLTHYTVLRPLMLSGAGKILLFVDSDFLSNLEWGFMASRVYGFFSLLESLCGEGRILLKILPVDKDASPAHLLGSACGALIWASSRDSFLYAEKLLRGEKPVVVIDVMGDSEVPETYMRSRHLTIFRIADETAGAMVCRHLLHLGHRRIGYFSHDHAYGFPYTLRRFRGITHALQDAGMKADHAVLFSYPHQVNKNRSGAPSIAGPVQRALRQARGRFLKVDAPQSIRDAVVKRLDESDYFLEIGRRMEPCFEAALTDRSITAWIAEGDSMAIHAILPFLRKKGVAVPGRLSVATFESTMQCIQAGLTVADFRIHSCVRAAIEEILRPRDRKSRAAGANIREITPLVMERGSCGKQLLGFYSSGVNNGLNLRDKRPA